MCAFVAAVIVLCAIPQLEWKIKVLVFLAAIFFGLLWQELWTTPFAPDLPWYHFLRKYRPIHLIGYVDRE